VLHLKDLHGGNAGEKVTWSVALILRARLGARVADKIRLQCPDYRGPPEAEMAVGKNRHPAISSVNSAILRAAKPHRVSSYNTSVTEVSTVMRFPSIWPTR
jgi:hypothetical protein